MPCLLILHLAFLAFLLSLFTLLHDEIHPCLPVFLLAHHLWMFTLFAVQWRIGAGYVLLLFPLPYYYYSFIYLLILPPCFVILLFF